VEGKWLNEHRRRGLGTGAGVDGVLQEEDAAGGIPEVAVTAGRAVDGAAAEETDAAEKNERCATKGVENRTLKGEDDA